VYFPEYKSVAALFELTQKLLEARKKQRVTHEINKFLTFSGIKSSITVFTRSREILDPV
jgi:hypothetical protein